MELTQTLRHRLLVFFFPNFEVASWVITNWANPGRFAAFVDIAAVSAFPLDWRVFLENGSITNVFE